MLLRFYAKADALQRVPSFPLTVGQHDRYVGRAHDPKNPGTFPATREPFTCESDSRDGQRLKIKTFLDGDLWPADRETADHCQVPFVEVEFTPLDGETDLGAWAPKRPEPPALASVGNSKTDKDD